MNYSRKIKVYTRKFKRCHWPLKAAEADGGAVSVREGRGGIRRASGMWQGRLGQRQGRDEGGRGREETGVGIFFCVL